MICIVENKSGNYIYLYESVSFRNENGEPRNARTLIGRIDPKTGRRVFKPEYIERMRLAGTPVEIDSQDRRYSEEEIKRSSLRELGAAHLLSEVGERDGLKQVLRETFPEHWRELFMLSCFLVTSGEPFMHCEEWVRSVETLPVGPLSSQRISELLASIEPVERDMFYRAWCDFRSDREYLALDITSASSYSELIDDVEWGHNRDGEDLAQVNICMLMGERSLLPVYQTVFSGSLKDVSTFKSTLGAFSALTGDRPTLVVMDKGFFSKRNVDAMLEGGGRRRFVVAMPFTSAFAKNQVEAEHKDIDTPTNTIVVGADSMRAVTKVRAWGKGHDVYAHIYFNAKKAAKIKEALYADVATLKAQAEADPKSCSSGAEHTRYLNIRRSKSSEVGFTVSIKESVIDDELRHGGWVVLISNDIADAQEAMRIYRAKDVVEKGFLMLKRSLDIGRLRVHSQERMQNKLFVGFIALILMSELHRTMMEKGLYKSMTMKQMLRTLSKLRVQEVSGDLIVYPATKAQKEIFDAFDVAVPM
jgi:transposase